MKDESGKTVTTIQVWYRKYIFLSNTRNYFCCFRNFLLATQWFLQNGVTCQTYERIAESALWEFWEYIMSLVWCLRLENIFFEIIHRQWEKIVTWVKRMQQHLFRKTFDIFRERVLIGNQWWTFISYHL